MLKKTSQFFINSLILSFITLSTLLLFDFVLVKLDLLAPHRYLGNPKIGFGLEEADPFSDLQKSGRPHINSYGFKTVRAAPQIMADPRKLTIASVGDSHTALNKKMVPIEKQHPFVLEKRLQGMGFDTEVLAAGVPRFSPLQEYLVYKHYLKENFKPDVLIMNLYTGNDFYDLLRPDDRPYFSLEESGEIVINRPMWVLRSSPEERTWFEESRILDLIEMISSKLGQPKFLSRFEFLAAVAYEEGGNLIDIFSYILDIKKSLEPRLAYSGGYSAQILNQALFLKKHFPDTSEKSLNFFKHLLHLIKVENPELKVVISAIPSVALADRFENKEFYLETLARLSMSEDDVKQLEQDLYTEAEKITTEEGYVFLDTLGLLRGEDPDVELYNSEDFHINEKACEIIASAQARVIKNIFSNQSYKIK